MLKYLLPSSKAEEVMNMHVQDYSETPYFCYIHAVDPWEAQQDKLCEVPSTYDAL